MTKRILKWLHTQGYVDKGNDKIVELGLQRIKSTLESVLFSVMTSWLMGDIIVGLIFEMTYISIRIYAGGYHASSKRRCEYLSYGSLILCMILIFYVPMKIIIMHSLMLFAVMIILHFSPIDSPDKKLNSVEKKVFRCKSIIYLAIAVLAYSFFMKGGEIRYAKTIMYSVYLVAVGLIVVIGL